MRLDQEAYGIASADIVLASIQNIAKVDPVASVRRQLLDLGCKLNDYANSATAKNLTALGNQYTTFLTYLDNTRDPLSLSYAFQTMQDFVNVSNISSTDRRCGNQVLRNQDVIIQAINDSIVEQIETCHLSVRAAMV